MAHTSTIDDQLRFIRDHLIAVMNATVDGRSADLSIVSPPIFSAHPISWLTSRLHLTPTEERVLWVLIAHELCPEARKLVRALNTEDDPDPTLDAIRRAVYSSGASERARRELGPSGGLWRLGLVEWIDETPTPSHRRTLKATPRVLALVDNVVELDPELAGCATLDVPYREVEDLEIDGNALCRIDAAVATGSGLVVVHGSTGIGRRTVLAAIARRYGKTVLQIDGRAIDTDRGRAQRQLAVIARECALVEATPLVVNLDALLAVGDVPDRLDLVERELGGCLVLASAHRSPSRRWRVAPTLIELPPLDGAARARLWMRALPEASPGDADLLATMYPLAPALINDVGRVACREAAGVEMRPEHIEAGLRAVLDDRLAGLATRISVSQTWDDLVLPEDQTGAIVELLARIRRRRRVYEDWAFADKLGRGLGVAALFSGPPGTGKTMCAGLIAKDLGTEVYQVDVSKIASKWIGETEKNLAALFDAAEAGCAVLLFDEADALFGKRTSVGSSNDHHANRQINFLLQRLESFTGVCILTTNHDALLDEAFRRRLALHVRFPMPDVDERVRLWEAMFPPKAPVAADLPIRALAKKYVMSGGHIRNAVLRAAFLAADEDRPIEPDHLTQAAQLEYEAMGRIAYS